MAYGTISGITKNWSDKEIKDASKAGLFFTSASTPTASTTSKTVIAPTTMQATKPATAPTSSSSSSNYGYTGGSSSSYMNQDPRGTVSSSSSSSSNKSSSSSNTGTVVKQSLAPVTATAPVTGQAVQKNIVGLPSTQSDVVAPVKQEQPQVAVYNPEPELEALRKAQVERMKNSLSNRYNQVVSDIAAQRANVASEYEYKRLGAPAQSQLQARNFSEFLANRGLSRSGTSQQAELMRNMQLQSTLNQYDKQMADELAYLQKQQDDAMRAYNSDITNAEQQAQSEYLTQLVQAKTKQDELRRQEALKREELAQQKSLKEQELIQKQYEADQKGKSEAEKAFIEQQNKEIQQRYNAAKLFSDTKGYFNPYYDRPLTEAEKALVAPYSNNFAAERDKYPVGSYEYDLLDRASTEKMFNDSALLQQYGDKYKTLDSLKSDRNYGMDVNRFNLDLGKFNYGMAKDTQDFNYRSEKDTRDFNYQKGRDAVKDTQWEYDYGLRQWVAQDSSARGWSSNEIAKQNSNINAGNLEQRRQENFNKQDEQSFKEIDSYITTRFADKDSTTGRMTMTEQDRMDVGAYLDDLAVKKVPRNIIESLRAKYNLD